MAKRHTDTQNQLFISPFRIYVHLRKETLHLVPLFTQLNEDPVFTRGIFRIVMLPVEITDNVKIVFNPLFEEFVNQTHDKNFNERDVIYSLYDLRQPTFESINFPDPTAEDSIRELMYDLTADLEDDVKKGIVKMLKTAGGYQGSARPNPNIIMRSVEESLTAVCDAEDGPDKEQIREISAMILKGSSSSRCIAKLEDTFGLSVWQKLDSQLRPDGDVNTSDQYMFSFFETGGLACPPKVRLIKTPKDRQTKTHCRYIIEAEIHRRPSKLITFEHTNSFAIYTWLILQSGELFFLGKSETKEAINAVVLALFGQSFAQQFKITSSLTEPHYDTKGNLNLQHLQQAVTNANRDIVNAYMPKMPVGRPGKDSEKMDPKQKAAWEKKIKSWVSPIMVQSNAGKDSGRFVPLPSHSVEICPEFMIEYHQIMFGNKPDWNFVGIYMPIECQGERHKQYDNLKLYLNGDHKTPSVRQAASNYDFDIHAIESAMKTHEEKVKELSSKVYVMVHDILEGKKEISDNLEQIRFYISDSITTREELSQYVHEKEKTLST